MTRAVLFVCTGNTCRSPAAAALFSASLASCGQEPGEWWVESAGLRAGRGQPASAEVQRALAERGIDLARHRSQPVEDVPVDSFDLILAMETVQAADLRERCPALSRRIFLLAEMAGSQEEVQDPFGGGEGAYPAMLGQLDRIIGGGMRRIIQLAKGKSDIARREP